MAAEGGVQTAHIIGWVVTGIATVGNLLWNLSNRWHTDNLAAQIRQEQYNRDIWGRFRARIQEKLDDLVELVCNLPEQLATLANDEERRSRLGLLGYQLVVKQDALSRALAETDASPHTCGGNWAEAAVGPRTGQESSWDLLLAELASAQDAEGLVNQLTHLRGMRQHVMKIEQAVVALIRNQDWLYEPPGTRS